MKEYNDHRKTTDLLGLLVFGIFALSVAAVLLTGAGAYRNLTARDRLAHEHRTAVRYLSTRFYQAPHVEITDFEGLEAMTIREEIGGRTYLTRVYCCDGYIRELFSGETAKVSPEDGQIILEARELRFAQDEELLRIWVIGTDGKEQQLLLDLSKWKGDQP